MKKRRGALRETRQDYDFLLPQQEFDTRQVVATVSCIYRHGGNASNTGGEYGYWDEYSLLDNGVVVHRYMSSASPFWLNYCEHGGGFQRCTDYCAYEAWESLESFANTDEEAAAALAEGGESYIDRTGHDYKPCQFGGGCIACYPCNHPPCYEQDEEVETCHTP